MNSPTPNRPLSYLTPGQKLGKYEIKSLLGRGGMAEVYRALNPDLIQDVAIKVLHPQVVDTEQSLNRFRKEAQAIASLSHPNIVRVYDFHADDAISFMVMELIEGPTLAQILRGYPQGMPRDLTLHIFKQLADAVAYAHERNIIHRDIKPSNVLLTDNSRPVLTDFGLARITGSARITASGTTSGTPAYMAPEVAFGEEAKLESDIYALGIMLYEMVSGDVPFKGETTAAVLIQHIQSPLPLVSDSAAGLDPAIVKVIKQAVEKDTENRYHSARDMIADLTDGTVPSPSATLQLMPPADLAATRTSGGQGRDSIVSRASVVLTKTVGTMQRNPILSSGLILTVVLVLIGAIVISEIQRLRPQLEAASSPTVTIAPTATPTGPAGMTFIPAGTFKMGNPQGQPNERPTHDVTLPDYFIDTYEVTNKDYLAYALDKGIDPPADWIKPKSINWVFDATNGFAMGTQDARFSYDGKVFAPMDGSAHFDVNADSDTGDVIIDVTGTLAYQHGQTKTGHWRIVQTTYSNDQDFFQGGVAVNVKMHGDSGQEAPFYPTVMGTLATWGAADVYLDDQLFMSDLGIHTMYIRGMRNPNHQILKGQNECCYSPSDETTGYVDSTQDQVFILLFTKGLYGAAPSPDAVWVELYFTKVDVTSKPDTASVVSFLPGTANQPVGGVSWTDAAAYCDYVGKRLPTEAEWEHAARGPKNTLFPWGDVKNPNDKIPANWYGGAPKDVGTYPAGQSGFGVQDMAGNVWEWVYDWYQDDYYATSEKYNPTGPTPTNGLLRVIRGGGFTQFDGTGPTEFTSTFRLGFSPGTTDPSIGFRCAKDVTPPS